MQRCRPLLSPKLISNHHPKNTVKWRPGSHGFYKPHYGASKMKWKFTLPYMREVDSLIHYPEVSRVTGKPINWHDEEPQDAYDGVRFYGEHTLELKGMPMGRTPEYMQERLRRFFAKFGPVVHCRANPHPLDPYQCEGTAYVSFRDKQTALKALQAPLKFPASLHDKVVSMRHLDSDKTNDPNYFEKAKFWNAEILALARKLHTQLCEDPQFQIEGKPLAHIGRGLLEREIVELPAEEMALANQKAMRGRGGVPLSKGGLAVTATTRLVPAHNAVKQRFGTWAAFLGEDPFDELFALHRGPAQDSRIAAPTEEAELFALHPAQDSILAAHTEEAPDQSQREQVVVKPRLVSMVQRTRILTRAKLVLQQRLHAEFSIWWREGKVPLPEYTQRRVTWWDHTPVLPWELQIQSRSRDRHRIFDERYLYRQQLVRARNEQRREKRSEWTETRQNMAEEKRQAKVERRARALAAVSAANCGNLLGQLGGGLVQP